MRIPYPYADDVLLRGNSATLRHLDINIGKDTAKVLNNMQHLDNKHKNLKVVIGDNDNCLQLVAEATRNKFINNLVGAAQSLKLDGIMSVDYWIAAAPIRGFKCLQVLDISWSYFAFFDVLCLLRVLPNLVKLSSSFDKLGSELQDIDAEDLPDHITSTHCRVGESLQVLSLRRFDKLIHPVVPEYVILLALVCPKLRRIELRPDGISEFQSKVAEALQSGPHSKYTSELNRLLRAIY
ncbi:hypothetical protein GGF41_006211 [Coemansia sp. RSA 2531]|nr:hypothetical protein GGF41_006211 [Coemansia sp. RSA 2531]